MGREKQAISPTAGSAVMSGSIGNALQMHAHERIVHFFMFVFAVSAACRRAAALGTAIEPSTVVERKASHQVDTGFRKASTAYYDFDDEDPAVIDRSSTSCRNTDAAHFCNLGLAGKAWIKLGAAATADPLLFDLVEMAKRLAGNTRHLPQRINIGPDRVIDEAHYLLAIEILKAGGPVVTRKTIGRYLEHAGEVMRAYRDGCRKAGLFGLEACCEVYLASYARGVEPPYYTLAGYIWAECAASSARLDRTHYLGD